MSRPPAHAHRRPPTLRRRLLGWLGGAIVVVGTLAVIVAAFALSYDAIRVVGISANVRPGWAWMLPVSIDGAMGVAAVAALVLGGAGRRPWYPWAVIFVGVAISVCCNALHASLTSAVAHLPAEWARVVSAIPPVMLALSIHLLLVLAKETMGASEDAQEEPAQEPVGVGAQGEPPSFPAPPTGLAYGPPMGEPPTPAQSAPPSPPNPPTVDAHDGPPTDWAPAQPVDAESPTNATQAPTPPTGDGLTDAQRKRLADLDAEFPGEIPGRDKVMEHMRARGLPGWSSKDPAAEAIRLARAQRNGLVGANQGGTS